MKPARSLIPIGTATLLPRASQSVRRLEDQLLAYLATWGYQEIILPAFEFLDVLSVGLAPEILEKCYKFADRASGRILVLRPDATAQIARMVAMGLGGEALPVRFSYRTTVFRYEPEHRGRDREVFQVGLELIGNDSPQSDAEMVKVLAGLLDRVQLPNWKISLGHVGFFKALLARSGLSPQGRKQAEFAAVHKDLPRLEQILANEGLPKSVVRHILQVPEQCGQQEVLKWGQRIAKNDPHLLKPLTRLRQVYEQLEMMEFRDRVLLDLGEFRGFDYYDGIAFDVFTSALGSELGGGGRYNHLVGRFGRELPAIGLGLDLDRLFSALEREGQVVGKVFEPVLLLASSHQAHRSCTLAQQLREKGVCVIEEVVSRQNASSIEWATNFAQQRGGRRVIVFEGKGEGSQSILFLEVTSQSHKPRQSRLSVQELFQRLRVTTNVDI